MKYVVLEIACAECLGGTGESLVTVLGITLDIANAKAIAQESDDRITPDSWHPTDQGEFYSQGSLGEIRIVNVDD